jgi:hypothetical protein
MFLYYAQRLQSVTGLSDDVDAADLSEQKAQLLARKLFVVYDDRAEG